MADQQSLKNSFDTDIFKSVRIEPIDLIEMALDVYKYGLDIACKIDLNGGKKEGSGRLGAVIKPPVEARYDELQIYIPDDYISEKPEEEVYEKYAEGVKAEKPPIRGKPAVSGHEEIAEALVRYEEEKQKKSDSGHLEGVIPWEAEDEREEAVEFVAVPSPPQNASGTGQLSADDWLDLINGKLTLKRDEAETLKDVQNLEVTGSHLKYEVDYHQRHVIPERITPREVVKKEPVREGLKKREYFSEVKLARRRLFTSAAKNPARLCSTCGANEKSKECVVCGKSNAAVMARLCEKCAGDKKNAFNCVHCGAPNSRVIAKLCENCAPSFARTCFRCGKRL